MKRTLQCQPGLVMKEAEVRDLIVRNGKVTGVVTDMGEILSQAVILATGTHLGGRVHSGRDGATSRVRTSSQPQWSWAAV